MTLRNSINGYHKALYSLSNLQLHFKSFTRSTTEMQNSMTFLKTTFNKNRPPDMFFSKSSYKSTLRINDQKPKMKYYDFFSENIVICLLLR